MDSKEILLVDDEEIILESFKAVLTDYGYEVVQAKSGEDAVDKLLSRAFDLVITDLKMPGLSGIDVLRAAKKINPGIAVMILTGFGDMKSAIEALRAGADDYILKPCNMDELIYRVEKCLDRQTLVKKVKQYERVLPVCVSCKKIRDDSVNEYDKDRWQSIEDYLLKGGVAMSHGYCPKCAQKAIEEIADKS